MRFDAYSHLSSRTDDSARCWPAISADEVPCDKRAACDGTFCRAGSRWDSSCSRERLESREDPAGRYFWSSARCPPASQPARAATSPACIAGPFASRLGCRASRARRGCARLPARTRWTTAENTTTFSRIALPPSSLVRAGFLNDPGADATSHHRTKAPRRAARKATSPDRARAGRAPLGRRPSPPPRGRRNVPRPTRGRRDARR
jgi:hypothetical protein